MLSSPLLNSDAFAARIRLCDTLRIRMAAAKVLATDREVDNDIRKSPAASICDGCGELRCGATELGWTSFEERVGVNRKGCTTGGRAIGERTGGW